MAARLAGIGPFRWGIRLGEGWRRSRSLPWTGLWPQTGGETPVTGRPAVHRGPGRGAPRSGGTPVSEAARLAWGGWGGCVELRGGTGPRRNAPEEGVLGSGRTDRTPACSGRALELSGARPL
jgi:hypothetical protein